MKKVLFLVLMASCQKEQVQPKIDCATVIQVYFESRDTIYKQKVCGEDLKRFQALPRFEIFCGKVTEWVR